MRYYSIGKNGTAYATQSFAGKLEEKLCDYRVKVIHIVSVPRHYGVSLDFSVPDNIIYMGNQFVKLEFDGGRTVVSFKDKRRRFDI